MEDRVATGAVGGGTLVGVFDGHEGSVVAEYAAANALDLVKAALARGVDPDAMWSQVFARLDPDVRHSGSTATLLFVRERRLSVAWVGDSRALLIGDWGCRVLTLDHRIDRAEELQRCVQAGAEVIPPYVIDPRTSQGLMMTRALGDRALRRIGIIPEPEVASVSLGAGDLGFVVASDGLWDVVSNDEAAGICRTRGPETAAGHLVEAVVLRDGADNVSVVVGRF